MVNIDQEITVRRALSAPVHFASDVRACRRGLRNLGRYELECLEEDCNIEFLIELAEAMYAVLQERENEKGTRQ